MVAGMRPSAMQEGQDTLVADPKYGSMLASKFINSMMWSGKKTTAQTRTLQGTLRAFTTRPGSSMIPMVINNASNQYAMVASKGVATAQRRSSEFPINTMPSTTTAGAPENTPT